MSNFVRRLRLGARRRWIPLLFGGAAVVWAVLYLFPAGGRGAELELLALGGDGRFSESISIPGHWAVTDGLDGGAVVRVPLILAVRNEGKKGSPPARLELTLPTHYRIVKSSGQPLPAVYMPGTPMARYELNVPAIKGASGTIAGYLPVLDTVWLEPIIPPYYCIALSDSVPDFVPAPPAPVEAIARVRIFYSFSSDELDRRQTGLLSVQLDPALLRQEVQPAPPVFPTSYSRPRAPLPPLSALSYVGSRRARCGDPQDPMEILSTLWETPEGGRLFVLDYGGAPRKYLFDLNRDSIIELEMWDATGSGQFDARRQARLPIPSFLMPPVARPTVPDDKTPEELLALDRYSRALTSRYQFRTRPPSDKPQTNRYRPGSIGSTGDGDEPRPGYTIRYWTDPGLTTARPATPTPPPIVTDARRRTPPTTSPPPPPPAEGRPYSPPTRPHPPTLGRPVTPDHPADRRPDPRPDPRPTPPRDAPARPPAPDRPAPDRPVVEREPAEKRPADAEPTRAPERRPQREPKVLGKPLDSIPPRPPPE